MEKVNYNYLIKENYSRQEKFWLNTCWTKYVFDKGEIRYIHFWNKNLSKISLLKHLIRLFQNLHVVFVIKSACRFKLFNQRCYTLKINISIFRGPLKLIIKDSKVWIPKIKIKLFFVGVRENWKQLVLRWWMLKIYEQRQNIPIKLQKERWMSCHFRK